MAKCTDTTIFLIQYSLFLAVFWFNPDSNKFHKTSNAYMYGSNVVCFVCFFHPEIEGVRWIVFKSDKPLQKIQNVLNPRSLEEKIVTQSLKGGSIRPPSTFDTICETMQCLIGFHGNNSQINDVTGGHHLGFLNFQILFKFSLLYRKLTGKQHLAVEIHEIGKTIVKLSV